MSAEEELYHKIAAAIPECTESKMFGALCIKAPNGKAGVMFWKEQLVVKLQGTALDEALKLPGTKIFDPMGGRPMNGWALVPATHTGKWPDLAVAAMEGVKKLEVQKKTPATKKTKK